MASTTKLSLLNSPMASTTKLSLLLLLLTTLSLSLSSVFARPFHPCNTLIISTYSFSLLNPNPNPNPNPQNRPQFILVSTDLRPYNHHHFRHRRFMVNPLSIPRNSHHFPKQTTPDSESESESFSSLKDRTKDILSVVASLVFGAVCGALTAGTMYLVWLIFNHRNDAAYRNLDGFNSDYDDDDNDDDVFNPKKSGYVAIPAAAAAPAKTVESVPAAVVVAKESA